MKFHPGANNIVNIIENEGAEAVMPDLMIFLIPAYTLTLDIGIYQTKNK